jgi:hypothetical protein
VTGIGVYQVFKKLGWSRLEAAARLGKNEKTIRRWIGSGAPPHTARVLSHLRDGKITPERAKLMLETDFERRASLVA